VNSGDAQRGFAAENGITAVCNFSENAKGDRVLLRVWRQGGGFFITVDNTKKK